MKKNIFVLSIAIFLSACASIDDDAAVYEVARPILGGGQWLSGHFKANPQSGTMTVIGVASRQLRRDDEIDLARNHAAEIVAMFHGMSGTMETVHRSGLSFNEWVLDSDIQLQHTVNHERFIGQLQFEPERDVYRHARVTLVYFTFATNVTPVSVPSAADESGRPEWTQNRNLPVVPGYNVAVGVARRQLWERDTIMRSAQATVARLIMDTNTVVENTVVDHSGYVPVTNLRLSSAGAVSGFRVLEFWIDPRTGYVFTLGIARA